MKPYSLVFVSLACLAVACSSGPSDNLGDSKSDVIAAPGSCADAGGSCVGLSPSSCTNGHWADATKASCGGGVGVGCCVPDETCPELVQPPPTFCPDGTLTPQKDATGCTTGFDCVPPSPPKNSCVAAGGQCTGLSPSSCPSGRWADATTASCGSGVGVGCCLPSCPELVQPPPTFCPDGTLTPQKDATGCTTGFDCTPKAQTDCEKAGGECVAVYPGACADGTPTNDSCGGGIGVSCCVR